MIIKKLSDVPYAEMPDHNEAKKQVVIGPDDGSNEIVMRYFTLPPGASSPHHSHDWPHLVRIEAGTGVVLDPEDNPHPVQAGHYLFIPSNDMHQFRNTGTEPFSFICIVPRRGEG